MVLRDIALSLMEFLDKETFGEDKLVSLLAAPEAAVRVAELFPSGGPAPV